MAATFGAYYEIISRGNSGFEDREMQLWAARSKNGELKEKEEWEDFKKQWKVFPLSIITQSFGGYLLDGTCCFILTVPLDVLSAFTHIEDFPRNRRLCLYVPVLFMVGSHVSTPSPRHMA